MHASTAVSAGPRYVRRGLRFVARGPGLYLAITVVYSLPALLAAYLVFTLGAPEPWRDVAIFVLPWLTLVLGTVVIMMVVGAHAHGRDITFVQATWRALPHVPRYAWTNAHTSLIFWIPIGGLLTVRRWQADLLPADALDVAWWVGIAVLGLYLHTRTLLAPFLAIHGDLPATLATLEAWRLSRQALITCISTLVAGSLPVALPLAALTLAVVASMPPDARLALEPALPDLAYAGIQIIRPLLIPATHLLFVDLWTAERTRRIQTGEPAIPTLPRLLLALTRPLPRLTPKV